MQKKTRKRDNTKKTTKKKKTKTKTNKKNENEKKTTKNKKPNIKNRIIIMITRLQRRRGTRRARRKKG